MLPIRDDSRTVNVWWFGTRGANQVIDQTAIQTALDLAALTNRAVYIPRGIYRITDTLLIGSNVRVFGDGAGETILQGKAGAYVGKAVNGTAIAATLGAGAKSHVTIEDLTIDHVTNGTTANGIALVPDLNFTGTPCSYCTVQRVEVIAASVPNYQIWSMRGQHMKILDNRVDGATVAFGAPVNQEGIEIFGGLDVLVDGNTVTRIAANAINVGAAVGFANVFCTGIVVTNNFVDASETGIHLGTAFDGGFGGAQNLTDVLVSGNVVRNSNARGIFTNTPIAGSALINVQVVGNDVSGGPEGITFFGIAADTGHRNVVARGNVLNGQTTVATGALAVISIANVEVLDNGVSGSGGIALYFISTTDCEARGNRTESTQAQAVFGDNNTRLVVNDNRFSRYGLNLLVGGGLITNAVRNAICGNGWSQAGAGTELIVTGTSAIVADNFLLGGGAANPFTNGTANPNFGVAAPGAGVAFVDVVNTLATNAVNTGAHIPVIQTAGASNPVVVTRTATGFRLTFFALAVGNETYQWEIRQ